MKYNNGGWGTSAIILSTTPCSLGCIHACKVLMGSVALLSYAQALFSIYIRWRNSGEKWRKVELRFSLADVFRPVFRHSDAKTNPWHSTPCLGEVFISYSLAMQPRFTVWNLAHPSWKASIWKFSRSPHWETNHSPLRCDKTNKRLPRAALKNHRTWRRGRISYYELSVMVDAKETVNDAAVAVFWGVFWIKSEQRKAQKAKLAKPRVLFNTAAHRSSSHQVISIKWRPLHQYKGWSCC